MEQFKAVQDALEKDADTEKDVYDKMNCWCQTYSQEKESIVEEMQQQLGLLSHDIEAQTAASTRLKYELNEHTQELSKGEADLNTAKALREKGAARFTDEEQFHVQSIGQLDAAIAAISKSGGTGLAFAQLGLVNQLSRASEAQSPEVVNGVLKQMRSTFHSDLQGLREEESLASDRHDGLVQAKAAEIEALRRRVEAKTRQQAQGGVEVAQESEQKAKAEELLDANVQLVASARAACKSNEDGFAVRQQLRQAALVDLAAARADLSGTQLLAVKGGRGRASDVPEDLCLFGHGLVEREWRRASRSACEKARSGHLQDAAEAVQDLVDEMKAAQANSTSSAEQCAREAQEVADEARKSSQAQAVHADLLSSDKHDIEEQIEGIGRQSSQSEKAKAALAEVRASQQQLVSGIAMTSNKIAAVVAQSRGKVPDDAATKLASAGAEAEKLTSAAASFDAASGKQAQDITSFLDGTIRAASRALIPLRLSRADKEEAEVSMHVQQHRPGPLSRLRCDANALSEKARKIGAQAERLGSISSDLAYAVFNR